MGMLHNLDTKLYFNTNKRYLYGINSANYLNQLINFNFGSYTISVIK